MNHDRILTIPQIFARSPEASTFVKANLRMITIFIIIVITHILFLVVNTIKNQ